MQNSFNIRIAALLCCFALSFQARAIVLDFSSLPGTDVDFSDGAFNFVGNLSGNQFDIATVTGGTGDSLGLQGYVSSASSFTIGTITTAGAEQTAAVTGTGTLDIVDSLGVNLTGSVQWENITTIGVGGILDLTGSINLTDLTYAGNNSDLTALAAAGSAVDVVTFQFTPAETLTQLATTGGVASYSGSLSTLTPAPEPATLTLAGMGLAGLLMFGRRRNK